MQLLANLPLEGTTMQERLERLEQKLAASERRLGRLQIAFVLAVVAGLCSGLVRPAVTQGKGTTVKAPFTVVGEKGGKLFVLKAGPHGGVLELLNQDGKITASVGADADGGTLAMRNSAGNPVIGLEADADGGLMFLVNKDGKAAVSMAVTQFGGALAVSNNDGRLVASLVATAPGGYVQLFDRTGKVRFTAP